MTADPMYREILPLFITHRKVRRSRCLCFLFLFLIAIFVGLVPIMVYRSLGVPLPDGLRGYRNIQPWMIVPQTNPASGPQPPDGADVQISQPDQSRSSGTTAKSRTIVIPETAQQSTSDVTRVTTNPYPIYRDHNGT